MSQIDFESEILLPNSTNALQFIEFGILYAEKVTSNSILQKIDELWDKEDQKHLPRKRLGHTLELKSNMLQPVPGRWFERFAPNGEIEARLVVEPDSLVYHMTSFRDWLSSSKEALDTLSRYSRELKKYNDTKPKALALRLMNVFRLPPESQYDWDSFFKKDSPLVPAFIFEQKKLWHLHFGWIADSEQNEASEIVYRYRCDALEYKDEQGTEGKLLQILADHEIRLKNSYSESPDNLFASAYNQNKNNLCRILNEKLLIKMGVKK